MQVDKRESQREQVVVKRVEKEARWRWLFVGWRRRIRHACHASQAIKGVVGALGRPR